VECQPFGPAQIAPQRIPCDDFPQVQPLPAGDSKAAPAPVSRAPAARLRDIPSPRLKAWALLLGICLAMPARAADNPVSVTVGTLAGSGPPPPAAQLASGALDGRFSASPSAVLRQVRGVHWVRLQATQNLEASAAPVITVSASDDLQVEVYPRGAAAVPTPLVQAAVLPGFGGTREIAFLVPESGLTAGQVFYARMAAPAAAADRVYLGIGTLQGTLARGAQHALLIALACGALAALALATAAMWLLLSDRLFILYAGMTGLQALYLAYFSGEGFRWPWLAAASGLAPYAWNVPVALGGAMASLFAREIADLRHTSPTAYRSFGWLATGFALLAVANVGELFGVGQIVVAIGNLMFLGTGVFVLAVAFLAWRRGNRAAGWFLFAWILLETFAIVTSARLLFTRAASNEILFYYGLPGSMVASAVLTSLGVADRLRLQRHALSEAERRAKTDSLTGVLNRRSLLEQLEAVCRDARANGLPVAVLFIDLDFFKSINDSHGHAAGDACLSAIVQPIQAELRQSDIVGRYGGEEFVVVLSGADAAAAAPIAERIRARVAEISIDGHGAPIQVTCSIGVASSDPLGVWGDALIAQADTAVYAAKRLGRNRVQIAMALAA